VTSTKTVQVAPLAIEPPENEIEALPAVGVNVGVPQPLVLALGVVVTTMAAGNVGNVSLNWIPVKVVEALGLVRVNMRVVGLPAGTEFGKNVLLSVGGESAVRLSAAVDPVPPFVELTAPLILL
jgi:hypothetical protein